MEAAKMTSSLLKQHPTVAFVKTVVTTTTLTEQRANINERLSKIVQQLQRTRMNFTKLSQLQSKRVRNMKKIIRKKNDAIVTLEARLNRKKGAKTKYFAVIICKNVVYTTSGSRNFVRQRAAHLCATSGGEQVFCEKRTDCVLDRRRIAEALAVSLGADVVTSSKHKRFQIKNDEKLISAKLIIQQVLHNGFNGDACTN